MTGDGKRPSPCARNKHCPCGGGFSGVPPVSACCRFADVLPRFRRVAAFPALTVRGPLVQTVALPT
jgi:hypothetical protein